jgi:hypothetical protein
MGKMDNLTQLAGSLSQFGAAMDPNPYGAAKQMGMAGYDSMQAEIMRREMKRQQEAEEKKKKQKFGHSLGATLGGIGGVLAAPFTGGTSLLATAGMAGLGSALGGAAGNAVTGGGFSPSMMLQDALIGGAGGALGYGMGNMGQAAKIGANGTPGPAMDALNAAVAAKSPAQIAAQGMAPQTVAGTALRQMGGQSMAGQILQPQTQAYRSPYAYPGSPYAGPLGADPLSMLPYYLGGMY